jgi:hypothetical protein
MEEESEEERIKWINGAIKRVEEFIRTIEASKAVEGVVEIEKIKEAVVIDKAAKIRETIISRLEKTERARPLGEELEILLRKNGESYGQLGGHIARVPIKNFSYRWRVPKLTEGDDYSIYIYVMSPFTGAESSRFSILRF